MFRDSDNRFAPNHSVLPVAGIKETKLVKASPLKQINAMTVDVEDYFQVAAFEPHIERSNWDKIECRVERNVDRILELFDSRDVKATFFTLGWIAKRYPELTRRMVDEGHELASHGWDHLRVSDQSPDQFSKDIIKTKRVLEDISGRSVIGYRAPNFSISSSSSWAYDVLNKAGYAYSSSITPINYAHYGLSDAPRFAHLRDEQKVLNEPSANSILEIPITTVSIPKKNLPCGGGGWFRLYPYKLSKWSLQWVNNRENEACVFYFHPWEIDPKQPRLRNLDFKTKFRHYQNISQMERKIDRLLSDFCWGRIQDVFKLE